MFLGHLKLAQANLKAVENVLAFHHDCFLGAFLVMFTAVYVSKPHIVA